MNEKFQQLYDYIKSQDMTDLDVQEFHDAYSNPESASELFGYISSEDMTDLNEQEFFSAYFGGGVEKKSPNGTGEEEVTESVTETETVPTGSSDSSSQEFEQSEIDAVADRQIRKDIGDKPSVSESNPLPLSGLMDSPVDIPPRPQFDLMAQGMWDKKYGVKETQADKNIAGLEVAKQKELQNSETTEQTQEIEQRYNELISKEEFDQSQATGAALGLQESTRIFDETLSKEADPTKKGVATMEQVNVTEAGPVSMFDFFSGSAQRPKFKSVEQASDSQVNSSLGRYQNLAEQNVDEYFKNFKPTAEELSDIKAFQDATSKTLVNKEMTSREKYDFLNKEYKRLQDKMEIVSFDKKLQAISAIEDKSVEGKIIELNDLELKNYLLNGEGDKKLVADLYRSKKALDEFADNNSDLFKFNSDGSVNYKEGITDVEKKYIDGKLKGLLEARQASIDSSYANYKDDIAKKRITFGAATTAMRNAKAFLSTLDKNSAEYKELATRIAKDQVRIDKLRTEIESEGSQITRILNTNPDEVIAEAKDLVKLSPSAQAAFGDKIEGLSSYEQFQRAYHQLREETNRMKEEGDFSESVLGTISRGARGILNKKEFGLNISKKEKEYLANRELLNSLAPILLTNTPGISKEDSDFFDSFGAAFARSLTGGDSTVRSQTGMLQDQTRGLTELGFTAKDFTEEDVLDQLSKITETDLASWEFAGDMMGSTSAIIAAMAVTKKGTKGFSKRNSPVRLAMKDYNKAMDKTATRRFVKKAIQQGADFEISGRVFNNQQEELSFEGGFLGTLGGELIQKVVGKIPVSSLVKAVASKFGSKGKQAVYVIQRAGEVISRGGGEVAEETIQELTQLYNSNLGEQGFWEAAKERFGDFDENMKFVVGSFLMGSAFGVMQPSDIKKRRDALSPEQTAVVDKLINEVKQTQEEVLKETVGSDAVAEVTETVDETPVADTQTSEVEAKEADIQRREKQYKDTQEKVDREYQEENWTEEEKELNLKVGDKVIEGETKINSDNEEDLRTDKSKKGITIVTESVKKGTSKTRQKVDLKTFDSQEAADQWVKEKAAKVKDSHQKNLDKIDAKYDAKIAALDTQTSEVAEEVDETPVAEVKLTEEQQALTEEIEELESEMDSGDTAFTIEDSELEISNVKEELKNDIAEKSEEIKKVRADKSLSKEERDERIEEIKDEKEDLKEEAEMNISNYKEDIQEAKKERRAIDRKIKKLKTKLDAIPKQSTETVDAQESTRDSKSVGEGDIKSPVAAEPKETKEDDKARSKKTKKEKIDSLVERFSPKTEEAPAKTPKQKQKTERQVDNAKKALAKVAPEVEIVVHETDAAYREATGEQNRKQSTNGAYNPQTKVIHINLSKSQENTLAHEVFHALLLSKGMTNAQAQAVTERMLAAVRKVASPDMLVKLDKFAATYPQALYSEESIAELFGILAAEFDTLPKPTQTLIKKWLDRLAKFFGVKKFTDEGIIDLLNTVSGKVASGEVIKSRDVRMLNTKSAEITDANKRFQADFYDPISGMTYTYDENTKEFKALEKDRFIIRDKSIKDFNDVFMILHQPDAAFSGQISKDGEILVEGKGGVYYPIKFHEKGYFWASTSKAAEAMAEAMNKSLKDNGGKIYLALTTAPIDKVLSSTNGANGVMDLFISLSRDPKLKIKNIRSILIDAYNTASFKDEVKIKGKIVKEKDNINASTKIDEVITKIKKRLRPDESVFNERKKFSESVIDFVVKSIGDNKKNQAAHNALARVFSEGMRAEDLVKKYSYGSKVSKANLIQAVSQMLSEPILRDVDSKNGSIYAVLEIEGEVEAVDAKSKDDHESYPKAIKSKGKSKTTLHLLTDRVKWQDVTIDPNTKDTVNKSEKVLSKDPEKAEKGTMVERWTQIMSPSAGVTTSPVKINTSNISEPQTRKQEGGPSIKDVRDAAKEEGLSKADTVTALKRLGFTQAEIDESYGVKKPVAKKKKMVAERVLESENTADVVKEKLERLDINYEIENQEKAINDADLIIKKLGIRDAYESTKNGLIRGGRKTVIEIRMLEQLNNELNQAILDGDMAIVDKLSDEMAEIYENKATTETEKGQEISMLKKMYKTSSIAFNVNAAKAKWKKEYEDDMPPTVVAKLTLLEEKIKQKEKELKELDKRREVEQEEQAVDNIKEEVKRQETRTEKKKRVSKTTKVKGIISKLDALEKKLLSGSYSDPTLVTSTIVTGIKAIKLSIKTYAKTVDIIEDSKLKEIINEGIKNIKAKLKKAGEKLSDEKGLKRDLEDALIDSPKIKVDTDIVQDGIKIPKGLLYELVEGGVDNITDLTNQVYEEIKDNYPGVTKREVRDAITKYGLQTNPTKDEIKRKLASLKIDGSQLSKLEDLAEGKRPKKKSRLVEYTKEQLKNIKEIQRLLRGLPIEDSADSDRYYKSALSSYKTRVSNRLTELKEALKNNEVIKNEKKSLKLDEEAEILKQELEIVQKEYNEMFDKTDEAAQIRIETALKRKDTSLRNLLERKEFLKLKGQEQTKVKASKVTSKEIQEIDKKIDKAREEYQQLLEDTGIAESKRVEKAIKQINLKKKFYEDKLKNRDFSKSKPKKIKINSEIAKAKREMLKAKNAFNEEFEKEDKKRRTRMQKIFDALYEVGSLPKGTLASFDLSAAGRQGVFLGSSNPKAYFKSFKVMHTALSEGRYEDFMAELENSENYELMIESGLSITDTSGKVNQSEEIFLSNLTKRKIKIKGKNVNIVGMGFAASERAYSSFLNTLRSEVFTTGVEAFKGLGITPENDPKAYKDLANFINYSTGRGELFKDENLNKFLNLIFFSPRMITSMYNLTKLTLSPETTKYVRKQALKSITTFIGYQGIMKALLGLSMYALSSLRGDEEEEEIDVVNLDPRDTDFNKLRWGNTRYDTSAGWGIMSRTLARVLTGEKVSGGKTIELNEEYKGTSLTEIPNFFFNKLSPTARFTYNYLTNTHPSDIYADAEDATTYDYIKSIAVPLTISSTIEDMGLVGENKKPASALKTSFNFILNTYGINSMTYAPKKKKAGKVSMNPDFSMGTNSAFKIDVNEGF